MEATINLNGAEIAHLQAETANAIAATQFELEAPAETDDSISSVDAQIKAMEQKLQLAKIERARKVEVIKRKTIAQLGPQLRSLGVTAEDLKDYLVTSEPEKKTYRVGTETWIGNPNQKGPKPPFISEIIWKDGKRDLSRLDQYEVK